ncbi:MAG TPA: citrate lyase subunit alpha [Casimicrobiaceae bacterium]|nr:citrate lyase subunit alpha [Casimicrobiaceae bacterium]
MDLGVPVAVPRALPARVEGYGGVRPFTGAFANLGAVEKAPVRLSSAVPGRSKLVPTIRAVIEACGLRDGGVVSFHHHLRNGDRVLELVLAEIARAGLRDITIAPSSLFAVHAPLVEYMKRGVVTGIHTAYMAGPVADAVSRGALARPATMCTHGGRARAIQSGDLRVDIAFIGAPTADAYGNINGVDGHSACGSLGYAAVDAECARHVVALTDNLVRYPACPIDITQDQVDVVVAVDSIGDPQGILSGTTRPTSDPVGLQIARTAADVIAASGLLVDDFSFQTGAGGISLAVAAALAQTMRERNVHGSFASGGITGAIVEMFHAGLFRALFDVQCFDLAAVDSYRRDAAHLGMSASMYANPHNRGAVVNMLDAMILGAAEIDVDFNVNVTTGTDGVIMGGSGGHADTAAGAKLAIVTTRLNAGGYAKVVDRVTTVTTPGETVDVLVTEAGVAVNPRRGELRDRLVGAGLRVVPIDQLKELAARGASHVHPAARGERVVAVVEYRDGTVTDVVRAVS